MPIRFACPNCKKALNAPDDKAGVRVVCPGCKQPLLVPTLLVTAKAPTTGGAEAVSDSQAAGPRSASKPPPLPKIENAATSTARAEGTVEAQPAASPPPLSTWIEKWQGLPLPAKVGIIAGSGVFLVVLVTVPILLFAFSGRSPSRGTGAGKAQASGKRGIQSKEPSARGQVPTGGISYTAKALEATGGKVRSPHKVKDVRPHTREDFVQALRVLGAVVEDVTFKDRTPEGEQVEVRGIGFGCKDDQWVAVFGEPVRLPDVIGFVGGNKVVGQRWKHRCADGSLTFHGNLIDQRSLGGERRFVPIGLWLY